MESIVWNNIIGLNKFCPHYTLTIVDWRLFQKLFMINAQSLISLISRYQNCLLVFCVCWYQKKTGNHSYSINTPWEGYKTNSAIPCCPTQRISFSVDKRTTWARSSVSAFSTAAASIRNSRQRCRHRCPFFEEIPLPPTLRFPRGRKGGRRFRTGRLWVLRLVRVIFAVEDFLSFQYLLSRLHTLSCWMLVPSPSRHLSWLLRLQASLWTSEIFWLLVYIHAVWVTKPISTSFEWTFLRS